MIWGQRRPKKCAQPGCTKRARAGGYCGEHMRKLVGLRRARLASAAPLR
jgi:hypothetical protein